MALSADAAKPVKGLPSALFRIRLYGPAEERVMKRCGS